MNGELVRKGILFILIGPAASGKSTLCERLVTEFPDNLQYSVSVTSRAPRAGEIPGKSYHFVSRDDFEARRERGEFFEWEETHGNLYGTLQSNLLDGISSGKDLLFQIDIRGAINYKRQFPDNVVTIFLLPPSFEAMRKRLCGRGAVDQQELTRRFDTARAEYAMLLKVYRDSGKFDYVVVNKDLDKTYDEVRAIVIAERARYLRIELESVKQFCEVTA